MSSGAPQQAPLEGPIRNAPRAVIMREGRILLLRKSDELKGERYALPGGAQELGETLRQALNRECLEEIGCEVIIGDLLHVADWFKPRLTDPPTTRHLVEFLFTCEVPESYQPRNGHHPDKHQLEVVWVPLATLHEVALLPRSLITHLTGDTTLTYLGTLD